MLLLVGLVTACGAPGSEDVFTRKNPTKAPADTPKVVAKPAPRLVTKVYTGYFRKSGDQWQFQPCGTSTLMDITAEPLARLILRDHFRWNAIWEGAKLYAVFQGATVTDTVKADSASADSSKAGPRTRFHLVEVKSMRTWERGDCNGMRISKQETEDRRQKTGDRR
jgi:hypothetical protein